MDPLTLNKPRIQSLDLLRGLVMIIMALDHVRDYYHVGSFMIDPTDMGKTNLALFATRWITHFCAPVFMFLAGTSAFLMGRKKTKGELSMFLLTRGLWLIFLELTIIGFGWSFQIDVHHFNLSVIWALGACMIFLSGLIWLPFNAILVIGLLLVCGHNALDTVHVQGNSLTAFGWMLLHEQGGGTFGDVRIFVMYPILSWIGVMALGYCLGKLYATGIDPAKRKKTLSILGSSAIAVFVVLRYSNIYGDAAHWSSQPSNAFSVLSFFNTTKYPPSLLYLTMTLGPALLFLAYSENITSRFSNIIKIYGRVPMFYYICHLYLIHLGAVALFFIQGFKPSDFDKGVPPGYGLNLGLTYAVWITVIILLYPLCKWYDNYKSGHRENKWLSYL
jgi:uncharacterized membrane protein